MRTPFLLFSLFFSVVAAAESTEPYADSTGWIDMQGQRIPDADNIKSIKGFGAHLLVTPDSDWEAKWQTPEQVVPNFNEADTVELGEALTILSFYVNPMTNPAGEVLVTCDIRVIRADGSVSVDEKDLICASGKLIGSPRNIRLSPYIMNFVGEPNDPLGTWVVEVNMEDKMRNAKLALKTSFDLVESRDVEGL